MFENRQKNSIMLFNDNNNNNKNNKNQNDSHIDIHKSLLNIQNMYVVHLQNMDVKIN